MGMPSLSDLKDSKYLTKDDCDPAIAVTITGFEHEDLSAENEACRMKWVIGFKEAKPLVLNITNIDALKLLFGVNPADWVGQKVTLWNDKSVMYKGERKGGVRVYVQQAAPVVTNPAHQQTIANAKAAAGIDKVPDHILEEQAANQPPVQQTDPGTPPAPPLGAQNPNVPVDDPNIPF